MDNCSMGAGFIAVFAVSGSVVLLAHQLHKRLLSDFMKKMEFELGMKWFPFFLSFLFDVILFDDSIYLFPSLSFFIVHLLAISVLEWISKLPNFVWWLNLYISLFFFHYALTNEFLNYPNTVWPPTNLIQLDFFQH